MHNMISCMSGGKRVIILGVRCPENCVLHYSYTQFLRDIFEVIRILYVCVEDPEREFASILNFN